MDERQLTELFRDAADDGPSATFGHADVVAASRRVTARRRMALAGGSTLGIAVLVGGIVVGGGYLRDTGGGDSLATAGSGGGSSSSSQVLEDQQERASTPGELAAPPSPAADKDGPESPAEQGRGDSGKVVPWPGLRDDGARAGCGPVDRELADALIRELPATSGVQPFAVPDACPPDARAAAIPVDGGSIYVVLGPVRGDGPPDLFVGRADGAVGYSIYTGRGNVLLVMSVPSVEGGVAPHLDRLQPVAEKLAQAY